MFFLGWGEILDFFFFFSGHDSFQYPAWRKAKTGWEIPKIRTGRKSKIGWHIVWRTGSVPRIELGFEEIGWEIAQCQGLPPFGGQRQDSNNARKRYPVRLSLCLYDICVLLQYRDEEDAEEEEEEISLLLLFALQGSHRVRRTDSLLRLQLTGDFIVLVLDPEAEPTRREDLRWDKEVCLLVFYLCSSVAPDAALCRECFAGVIDQGTLRRFVCLS